ncbi:MAG: hypothetical protein WAJ93_13745, partial [Candidatus Nitrosopolaris sp.]
FHTSQFSLEVVYTVRNWASSTRTVELGNNPHFTNSFKYNVCNKKKDLSTERSAAILDSEILIIT